MAKGLTYLLTIAAGIILSVSCSFIEGLVQPSPDQDTREISPYDKHIDFGNVPSAYYIGQQDDYSFGDGLTSASEIYRHFDGLIDGTCITREPIGTASDSSSMFMYRLTPSQPKMKIIIICAQHGFEKSGIYGTYYFLKDLKEKNTENEVLSYFRQNADFIVIPCANPYGIDTRHYLNANGVNLNRNWPVADWTYVEGAEAGQSEFGGISGGDQPEVQNIVKILEDNRDALLVIDFHTNGSGNIKKGKLNWLSMTLNDDPYRDLLLKAGEKHLQNISALFEEMYPEETGNEDTLCGYMDWVRRYSKTGYLSTYAAQQNFLSLTFEGFNGFPHSAPYSDNVKKANSELLGNYLATLCEVLNGR